MPRGITRLRLENGLLVLLREIHTAPLASVWTWYRVGSRDELPGQTGISHWVEHMQFKGTPRFPPGALDRAISREGGSWNAFTYMDWTAYYATLPADRMDLALRIEADRMTGSLFDPREVESERTVVLAEREGNENDPLFLLSEAVQQAAFRVHPYHHEVIGDAVDLRSMTRDDLYAHYRAYYIPNNAVLSLAGDFRTADLLPRIRRLFDHLPPGPTPRRVARPEPSPRGEARVTVNGPGETTYLQVSWHAPRAAEDDFFTMTVLDSLLAGPSSLNMFGGGGTSNKTSRLYCALVDTGLAVSVYGGTQATIDPFLYTLVITVHPRRHADQVLAALDAEIMRLHRERVPPAELARAVKQARAMFAYGSENITNQAFWLGHAEMFADYRWFLDYLKRLAAVTPADLQRVARRYLQPSRRVVGVYLPQGDGRRA